MDCGKVVHKYGQMVLFSIYATLGTEWSDGEIILLDSPH